MKLYNWIILLACLLFMFTSCDEEENILHPTEPEPDLLEDSYVYMSTEPGACGMDMYADFFQETWHLCVHAPDILSVGVYFWIEPYEFGPEDNVSIIPADGISYEGDLFTGLTIHWDERSFDHESVLSLQFTDNPPTQDEWQGYIAEFNDSELFLEGGRTVYLEDVGVEYIYCGSYGGGTIFRCPDSFLVDAGQDIVIVFEGIGSSPGPYAAYGIHAVDDLGWSVQLTPESIPSYCAFCPWLWIDFELQVSIPEAIDSGTRSSVSILDVNEELLARFVLIVE